MRLSPIPCLLALIAILSLGACETTGMIRVEPASEPGSGDGAGDHAASTGTRARA